MDGKSDRNSVLISVSFQFSVQRGVNIRILITGSRNWQNPFVIGAAIQDYIDDVILNSWNDPGPVVIVHGDAPGADYWAKLWAIAHGHTHEAHPALWGLHGKAAGPRRNQEMVDLGAEVVLAFPSPGSKGTYDCIKKAKAAGLIVKVFEGAEYDITHRE